MKLVKIPISQEQRGMIFGLCKDLGIDNACLHEYMLSWANVSSLKGDLCSKASANVIIECLQKMSGSTNKDHKPGDATAKQIKAIKAIAHDMNWNEAQLNGFIKHTAGKANIEGLKMNEASQVITGLKRVSKTPVKSR